MNKTKQQQTGELTIEQDNERYWNQVRAEDNMEEERNDKQTGEGDAPRVSDGAIRCNTGLEYAVQRLSDARDLYPTTSIEIAKRDLLVQLLKA